MRQPAFVLVRPQLGENIGKAARAMLNFSFSDMRLVAPRDGWPNPDAGPSASGADTVLDRAQVYQDVPSSLADVTLTFATTVRPRDMAKPVVTPREAAKAIKDRQDRGETCAILFGPERSGMTNDDIALADAVLTVPVNPEFGSLNLAQAVILIAYELHQLEDDTPSLVPAHPEGQAPKEAILALADHLSRELEARGFFRSEDRYDTQRRMLLNLLHNAALSVQEVQTWRGIIKTLTRFPKSGD